MLEIECFVGLTISILGLFSFTFRLTSQPKNINLSVFRSIIFDLDSEISKPGLDKNSLINGIISEISCSRHGLVTTKSSTYLTIQTFVSLSFAGAL
jgi:hypothetical protein